MRVAGFRRLVARLVDPGPASSEQPMGQGAPAPDPVRPFYTGRHSGPLVAGKNLGIATAGSASDQS